MRYVRPFDLSSVADKSDNWLIQPGEGLGCAIRLAQGDHEVSVVAHDRFGLVLEGEGILSTSLKTETAAPGNLMFIPANVSGAMRVTDGGALLEIRADEVSSPSSDSEARVAVTDESRFEGQGFAHQALFDRNSGVQSMRINMLQVEPGAGSPDFHIHRFTQIYVILDGAMTIDIGRSRLTAEKYSVACLPDGVVHRNFNASSEIERHISLLVPEPLAGEVFDYAVKIFDAEAALLTQLPQ